MEFREFELLPKPDKILSNTGDTMVAKYNIEGKDLVIKSGKNLLWEATILEKFKHPNIIGIMHLYKKENLFAGFAMEYYPSMKKLIINNYIPESKLVFPLETVQFWGIGLLKALHYIHSAGIIHADIKPYNILIKDGEATLIDFGISQDLRYIRGLGYSGRFKPPEILLEGLPDEKSDIWALGCTLYECLTGAKLFPESLFLADIFRTQCSIFGGIIYNGWESAKKLPKHYQFNLWDYQAPRSKRYVYREFILGDLETRFLNKFLNLNPNNRGNAGTILSELNSEPLNMGIMETVSITETSLEDKLIMFDLLQGFGIVDNFHYFYSFTLWNRIMSLYVVDPLDIGIHIISLYSEFFWIEKIDIADMYQVLGIPPRELNLLELSGLELLPKTVLDDLYHIRNNGLLEQELVTFRTLLKLAFVTNLYDIMDIEVVASTILELIKQETLEWTSEINLIISEFEKIEKSILKREDSEILESVLNGRH